jgi:hypothetical protein
VSIPALSSGNLTLTGGAGQYPLTILGSSTSGQSHGLLVQAGTNASDDAIVVQPQAGLSAYFERIFGDGHGYIGPNSTNNLSWDINGAYTIATPSLSTSCPLTVNGPSNQVSFQALGGGGIYVQAGNSFSNASATFSLQSGTVVHLIAGSGENHIYGPSATTDRTGSNLFQAGFIGMPPVTFTASNHVVSTHRSKSIILATNSGQTFTLPIGATAGFLGGDSFLLINNSGGNCSLANDGTSTINWFPSNVTTSPRTLAQGAIVTCYYAGSNIWWFWGFGIS